MDNYDTMISQILRKLGINIYNPKKSNQPIYIGIYFKFMPIMDAFPILAKNEKIVYVHQYTKLRELKNVLMCYDIINVKNMDFIEMVYYIGNNDKMKMLIPSMYKFILDKINANTILRIYDKLCGHTLDINYYDVPYCMNNYAKSIYANMITFEYINTRKRKMSES